MKRPAYIKESVWDTMSWKEQDFVIFCREKQRTKNQIKRKLYITTDTWYYKLQKKVSNKIKANG